MSDSDAAARLLSGMPGMAYRCRHDANWSLEYASEGARELLGVGPEQLVERQEVTIAELIHPDDLTSVSLGVERAVAARRPFQLEYRVVLADGTVKWIWERGRGVFSEDGQLEALEGFLMDVTEHRATEEALRRAQRADAVGQVAAGVAHDFNNLLTVISCSIEAAERHLSSERDATADLHAARDAARSASELVQRLLAMARPGPDGLGTVELTGVVRATEPLLRRAVPASVVLHLALSGTAYIHSSRSQVEQVLMNLVTNARDAMPSGGQVTVAVESVELECPRGLLQPGRYVELSVRDNGSGMTAETVERAFDPFYSTKAEGRGTGLGLSVVQQIARGCGGDVELQSQEGRGTQVRIVFPAIDPPRHMDVEPHAAGNGRVVLVVEDEEPLRRILVRALRGGGFTTLEAADGRTAIALSERHKGPIDIVISDLAMPHLTGDEVLRTISATRPGVKALLISGNPCALPDGCEALFLAKPFSLPDLFRTLDQMWDGD